MIKLWARVGMTLEVTPEEYEAIKAGEISNEKLRKIISNGKLDGETYFPEIDDEQEEMGDFYL